MTRAISLVVTDLDGTLWDSDEQVHDRTLAALAELADRQVPVLVATGRRLRSAQPALARHRLALPAVLLDGAMGRDLRTRARFHDACFPPEAAMATLTAFADAGLSPAVYVERPGVDVVVARQTSTHPEHLSHIGVWLARADLAEVVATDPVYAFAIVDADPAALEEVARELDGAGTPTISHNAFFPGATITVRPPQTSKWEGVLAYCGEAGLDPTRVLAVGDGANDLELLDGAAVSCVVRDGCEAALALADHVIEPACDGGWSSVLGWCGARV